jgi:Cupin superfamily protein
MSQTRMLLLSVSDLGPMPDVAGLRSSNVVPDANHVLARIFDGLSPQKFLDRHWGHNVYWEVGKPDRFHNLMSWEELNLVLDAHRAWPSRMQVAQGNQSMPPSSYVESIPGRGVGREPALRVSSTKLHARLREGATLVFGSVDEVLPAVRALTERLEYDLQAEVFVNLYASWGQTGAFAPHWDDHDGIILQIYGRKEWQIFGAGRPFPLPGEEKLNYCPAEASEQFVLPEGGALYLPRGCWHAVRPVGATTVHLTFGLRRPAVRDFLRWVVDRQARHEEARADLPLMGWNPRLAQGLAGLREQIDLLLTAEGVQQYLTERDGRVITRPRHALPSAVCDLSSGCPIDAVVILAAARPVACREDGYCWTLIAGGKRYEFNPCCKPVLRRLLDRTPWQVDELATVSQLEGGPAYDECRVLIADLLRHGLLNFADLNTGGGAGGDGT